MNLHSPFAVWEMQTGKKTFATILFHMYNSLENIQHIRLLSLHVDFFVALTLLVLLSVPFRTNVFVMVVMSIFVPAGAFAHTQSVESGCEECMLARFYRRSVRLSPAFIQMQWRSS